MSTDQPWTIGRLLEWTTQFLAQKGSEFPRLDTEVLLAHVLNCKRIAVYTRFSEEASPEVRQQLRELIRQRIEGCPVAYLVGRKEFYSLEFEVSRDVLIPRADSETAVGECLRLAKGVQEPAILDIGTGSGNLAVAIAYHHKSSSVTAIDVSPSSLAIARRNAEKNGVTARVRFLEGDLFAPLAADERFDFIVSNPPYIPHADIAGLAPGVRDYEPHLALDGGPDGFVVFERLIAGAAPHLKPGGYLIVEIGSPQEAGARKRLEALTGYELAPTVRDSSGHPRVLLARWQG